MEKAKCYCGKEFIKSKKTKLYCSQYCRDKTYMDKLYLDKERHEHLKSLHRGYIHKEGTRFTRYKSGAKIRSIPFELSKEQFLSFWNKSCHYCGEKIEGVGLDRLDNSKGYSIKNCVSCCTDCNKMKMTKTVEKFIKKCYTIVNTYDSKRIR